jgi:hypothetical protein
MHAAQALANALLTARGCRHWPGRQPTRYCGRAGYRKDAVAAGAPAKGLTTAPTVRPPCRRRLAGGSRVPTPEGSPPACAWGDVATPIQPMTGWPSLPPSSSTRCPVRLSDDSPCYPRTAGQRAYHVPPVERRGGLGRVSAPVVHQLRRRRSEPPDLTTCLLAQACQHRWLVLSDDVSDASPGLTMPPHPRP